MHTCSSCSGRLEHGYVFSTKDGALSFADTLPSSFESARHTPGFVELTSCKIGGRTAIEATICRSCRQITIVY